MCRFIQYIVLYASFCAPYIQSQSGSIKVSMVYLTMIQEAQNVVTYTINLMKVSRKFQVEKEEL